MSRTSLSPLKLGVALLSVLTCIGCIEHTYTATASTTFPPKPATCDFAMSTAGASSEYQEIGTIAAVRARTT
jgi:hypothetical protein